MTRKKKETVQQVSRNRKEKISIFSAVVYIVVKEKKENRPETFELVQFSRTKVSKNNEKLDVPRAGAREYFLRSLYFLAGATGRKGSRKRQFKGEKGTKEERDW